MPSAPLAQPAPFTCPNCGAALESKSGLCPRCGARLDAGNPSSLSVATSIALTLGLIVFGAIGACGGAFFVSAWRGRNYELGGVILSIAGTSLAVGLIGFALCLLPFFRRKR